MPNYCGSGKKQTDKWMKATINPDKIKDFIQEYEGNKFVKININILDEPNKYGKDVSITIDEFVPKEKKSFEQTPKDDGSSLPF